MFEDGPWFGLCEGETFEDMIFHALTEHEEHPRSPASAPAATAVAA